MPNIGYPLICARYQSNPHRFFNLTNNIKHIIPPDKTEEDG